MVKCELAHPIRVDQMRLSVGVVVVSLIVQFVMPGWWWSMPCITAIIVLLVKDGREVWGGEESEELG
jgi:hypothetical protein